ncbi:MULTISPECIES: MBL fold metallo-hydrolase [unclassified Clostridium]|uniref:MBL fold metallo-hydrolase n=1 Tax=unclassified Clostridium TaxID=2614128 RepID=UPI000297B5AA|nr:MULTISPECIES: MBL fold metallo-hydrolase [unclassified Clostridium]EKQ53182.1 MAG: metal-dependent hydrolase, beta-lactamase superfamily III [Clostridium sp. Maddingley MBC34-26]
MEKINILGTGSAMVTKCYNTCFTLSKDDEHFLIDAGGGNTILANLEKLNISINQIHNMFISHNHNDHILGSVWVIRAAAQSILNDKYTGNLNIYCHETSIDAIKTICSFVLQKKFLKLFDNRIVFNKIDDSYSTSILDRPITFFDIHSTKDLQYGFKTLLLNGKSLTFLGDEPYRETVKTYCENVDYLLHEAFCLYSQRDIFKPYEKHHATAKDACKNAQELNVKNVILYHTEDKDLENRKKLYIAEGKEEFHGNIYMPDDLDVITL